MAELEEIFETLECRGCGQPFRAQVAFPIAGLNHTVTFRPRICPACWAPAPYDAAKAEAERQREREKEWAQICPIEFRLQSESNGETDLTRLQAEAPLLDKLLAWADSDRKRGLLLRGPTGTSKTRAMWRLLRILWEQGVYFRVVTSTLLEAECQKARDEGSLESWIRCLKRVPVLFWDDLGKMRFFPSTEAVVFDVLDGRMNEHRPVLITTEDTGETLAARLSGHVAEAFIRRLRDYCTCLEFGLANIRE